MTARSLGKISDYIETEYEPNGGRVPRLSGDIRHLVPRLGLREYWYPLCGAGRVKKNKPLRIKMLGEEICVFRGKEPGEISAVGDICPHRGARLSEGDCHFAGTVACPYHGWVFDGSGKNIAVLSEGPNSQVCGKPGTEVRSYPTQVHKGVVFIWMGEGEPADIREDVGEEFFMDKVHVFFNERIYWRTNWEIALENTMDSHVGYLHRDYLLTLLGGEGASPGRPSSGMRPYYTGIGFIMAGRHRGVAAGQLPNAQPGAPGTPGARPGAGPATQATYPDGSVWPKHRFRRMWKRLFQPWFYFMNVRPPLMKEEKWLSGHQLPGQVHGGRNAYVARKGFFLTRPWSIPGDSGISFGMYTRQTVPVEEWLTRVWYMHGVATPTPLHKLWAGLLYWTWGRWHCDYNFSQQDMSVMLNLDYTTPEKLSATDAEVVQWRRFVVTKHFGGRNHPFEYDNREVEAAPPADVSEPVPAVVGANAGSSGNGHGLGNGR